MNTHHLKIVPDQEKRNPAAVTDLVVTGMEKTGRVLDDTLGLGLIDDLTGPQLVAFHNAIKDLIATATTIVTAVENRMNQWLWRNGDREGPGGPTAEINGVTYQATMAGGPSQSLKAAEKVALGHAIFERAINEAIRGAGLDPANHDDPQVNQLRIFGSVLDALIVGRGNIPPAARLDPLRTTLAAGLVDPATGEIAPTPDGGIRWALNVANYETPAAGTRRRSFARIDRATTTKKDD